MADNIVSNVYPAAQEGGLARPLWITFVVLSCVALVTMFVLVIRWLVRVYDAPLSPYRMPVNWAQLDRDIDITGDSDELLPMDDGPTSFSEHADNCGHETHPSDATEEPEVEDPALGPVYGPIQQVAGPVQGPVQRRTVGQQTVQNDDPNRHCRKIGRVVGESVRLALGCPRITPANKIIATQRCEAMIREKYPYLRHSLFVTAVRRAVLHALVPSRDELEITDQIYSYEAVSRSTRACTAHGTGVIHKSLWSEREVIYPPQNF